MKFHKKVFGVTALSFKIKLQDKSKEEDVVSYYRSCFILGEPTECLVNYYT